MRKWLTFSLVIASLAYETVTAKSEVRITYDPGGRIGIFIQKYVQLRNSGQNIVVDGTCVSACTLFTGIMPAERVCVTKNARLGFHAAWTLDEDGRPQKSQLGTQALWHVYPRKIRDWISKHGGLKEKMIYLQGRQLSRMYQTCLQDASAESSEQPKRVHVTIYRTSAGAAQNTAPR